MSHSEDIYRTFLNDATHSIVITIDYCVWKERTPAIDMMHVYLKKYNFLRRFDQMKAIDSEIWAKFA